MNHGNYGDSGSGNQGPDSFDRKLDETLANYAKAEPRQGLENRIMARIKTHDEHIRVGLWWVWLAGTFVALSIILAIFIPLKSSRAMHYVAVTPAKLGVGMPELRARALPPVKRGSFTQTRPRPNRQTVQRLPTLDQFPSSEPLSEQEKVLADYVARFRDEAVLIARVNSEELLRDRAEMNMGSETNSDLSKGDEKKTTNR
jgi:hypothetical protein